MNTEEILTEIRKLESRIDELRSMLYAQVVIPVPPPAVEFDERGLMKKFRMQHSARVDAVVPPGTPNTVTLPVTGHTLSVARPDIGEAFIGYCVRVSDQAGGNSGAAGSLFLGSGWVFERFGGFKADGSNWPQAADFFYNESDYWTPEERAKHEADAASWGKR